MFYWHSGPAYAYQPNVSTTTQIQELRAKTAAGASDAAVALATQLRESEALRSKLENQVRYVGRFCTGSRPAPLARKPLCLAWRLCTSATQTTGTDLSCLCRSWSSRSR